MLAGTLQPLENAAHPIRNLTIDAIDQEFGVAENGVQRRPQLVAHIGKELRLVPVRELAFAQSQLRALALGDIVVGLEDRSRPPLLVPLQGPAARHFDRRSVSRLRDQLPFPTVRTEQLGIDLFKRSGSPAP